MFDDAELSPEVVAAMADSNFRMLQDDVEAWSRKYDALLRRYEEAAATVEWLQQQIELKPQPRPKARDVGTQCDYLPPLPPLPPQTISCCTQTPQAVVATPQAVVATSVIATQTDAPPLKASAAAQTEQTPVPVPAAKLKAVPSVPRPASKDGREGLFQTGGSIKVKRKSQTSGMGTKVKGRSKASMSTQMITLGK